MRRLVAFGAIFVLGLVGASLVTGATGTTVLSPGTYVVPTQKTTTVTTTTTLPASTVTTTVTGPTTTLTSPPPNTYFSTQPSAACSTNTVCDTTYPLNAATCAAEVPAQPETITSNATDNATTGDGNEVWNTSDASYWKQWAADLSQVAGQYTGTTSEIFSWAACRWGIDENLLRAVAVNESHWHNNDVGDYCGTPGEGSYGIMQVKNKYCNGSLSEGGYPETQNSTALALDYYAAKLRACFDGAFYDGGSWLYGGQSVAQIAAAKGWDYVLYGCVGYWYSGSWYDSGATSYIATVKNDLANQAWVGLQ